MYNNPLDGWQDLSTVSIPPRKSRGFETNVLHREIWKKQEHKAVPVCETPTPEDDDQTVLLQQEQEDCTVLLTMPEVEERAYIIRTDTNERIDLAKDVFTLGKSGEADYQIHGNDAISRKHVKVTKKDHVYYLEDLNSSNHTYIEDAEVHESVALRHGQVFKMADEAFSFYIEQTQK